MDTNILFQTFTGSKSHMMNLNNALLVFCMVFGIYGEWSLVETDEGEIGASDYSNNIRHQSFEDRCLSCSCNRLYYPLVNKKRDDLSLHID